MSKSVTYCCNFCGSLLDSKSQNGVRITSMYIDGLYQKRYISSNIEWNVVNDEAKTHICCTCMDKLLKNEGENERLRDY